ncbi:sensor histidine kinase [Streptomyces otsuchiensis]|uniref:sensor histidine kinase n=1 Tax=Streptomyces otsuchiensis TaxID=2681388 RepID=UPI00103087BE|nr:histidine kinase [Streptomyces otsuchiensis]
MPLSRPHRDDVVISVAGLAAGLLTWSLGLYNNPAGGERSGAVLLVPLVVMAGLELLRRSPRVALPLALPTLAGDLLAGSLLVTVVMFTDIVYAAARYGSPRLARSLLPLSVAGTVALTVGFLVAYRQAEALLVGAVFALITLAPASTGVIVRHHRDVATAERLRAEQTALLAEMDRTQAVTAERARMARELHDVVANHLSAIAIHSSAALSLDDRDTSHRALTVIRENSTQGLAEMRQLIGILREEEREGGDRSPVSPTLDGLDALLDHARAGGAAGGLRFVLEEAPERGVRLPAPVELAGYRIVQESLTNAVKHASPGTVAVRVRQAGGTLEVTVTSACAAAARTPAVPGAGAGLLGMAERAELLGGTFGAGRHTEPDGSVRWRVRAVLPTGPDAVGDGPVDADEGGRSR